MHNKVQKSVTKAPIGLNLSFMRLLKIPPFPRPAGLPEDFLVRITDRGAGMLYVHPEHTHTSIRVMPGKPHSPFPYQQKPYVIQMKDGKTLDKFGNKVLKDAPEAHIPLNEYFYMNG